MDAADKRVYGSASVAMVVDVVGAVLTATGVIGLALWLPLLVLAMLVFIFFLFREISRLND